MLYTFARKVKGAEHLFYSELHLILDGKERQRASLYDLLGVHLHDLYHDFLLY